MIYVRHLIWDNWNREHIVRHTVSPEEVEQLCHGEHVVLQSYQGRLIPIGRVGPRVLAAVLNPQSAAGSYYPITARDASRKERAYFRQQHAAKGGGDDE